MSESKKVADLVVGDFVCVEGFGTANMLHEHGKVARLTKLYVIVRITSSNLNRAEDTRRRFRRDDGYSVPRGDGYGGTSVHSVCQRKKKSDG